MVRVLFPGSCKFSRTGSYSCPPPKGLSSERGGRPAWSRGGRGQLPGPARLVQAVVRGLAVLPSSLVSYLTSTSCPPWAAKEEDVSQRVKLNGEYEVQVNGLPHMHAKDTLLGSHWAMQETGQEGQFPRAPSGHCCDGELLGATGEGVSTLWWWSLCPQKSPHSAVGGPLHTCLICLNPSGCTLEKMLHSGWARIWKATAQWWFSRGEMSL